MIIKASCSSGVVTIFGTLLVPFGISVAGGIGEVGST
jgi:hypothetical protein